MMEVVLKICSQALSLSPFLLAEKKNAIKRQNFQKTWLPFILPSSEKAAHTFEPFPCKINLKSQTIYLHQASHFSDIKFPPELIYMHQVLFIQHYLSIFFT